MSFDIAKALASAGVKIDTAEKVEVEYISFDLIVPDPNNFYELSDLDELAASIAMVGLQQPLLVRPMAGDDSQVIITSGHRRHAALKMLIDDGRQDLFDVPCIVCAPDENPKISQLKLIMANSTARKISSSAMVKQADQIEKILCELKEDGYDFPGRMRDYVAKACNVSTGKLGRLKVIQSGLTPPLREAWERGQMTDETAYKLAKQDPTTQQEKAQTMEGSQIKTEPRPLTDSPYKRDIEAALAAERKRQLDIRHCAVLYLQYRSSGDIIKALRDAACRNDVIEAVKKRCARYENVHSPDFKLDMGHGHVIIGDRSVCVKCTATEFADGLLLAAAQILMSQRPEEADE